MKAQQRQFASWIIGLLLLCLWTSSSMAQEFSVLRSSGDAAVIDAGSADGIQSGNLFRVYRREAGTEKDIATVQVTHVLFNMTRIEVTERVGNETILQGDLAERIEETSIQTQEESGSSLGYQDYSPGLSQRTPAQQRVKGVYLGPTAGMFIPLGDMKDVFENNFGYGGILGLQFKPDLDVSMRFFFTAKSTEWSIWNLQLLGRRYVNERILFDFGYGILYPKVGAAALGSGDILLGFIAGTGYTFPAGMNTWIELGVLYHYYPNFGDKVGQFMTIQGRLIL
ncbi:hypothetical protein HQ585_05860 [candidate division KSB1 bacterium]|nr:hypothetical protein [candidate division KSB1 bacterium]